MSTTDIYKKHFGPDQTQGVGIFHPNMEPFFEELNDECKREDLIKAIASTDRDGLATTNEDQ